MGNLLVAAYLEDKLQAPWHKRYALMTVVAGNLAVLAVLVVGLYNS